MRYRLWVHFTPCGRDFDLFYKMIYEERRKISEKLKARREEYILIAACVLIITAVMFFGAPLLYVILVQD